MNLISSVDTSAIVGAMDDLWDSQQRQVTIVKEPQVTVNSLSGTYVPGFGETANPTNFNTAPESKTFICLSAEKFPDNQVDYVTDKVEPKQVISLKVKQDCRDYILDGRRTLHAIHQGRKYNILTDEEVCLMLSRTYYIFRLELIT